MRKYVYQNNLNKSMVIYVEIFPCTATETDRFRASKYIQNLLTYYKYFIKNTWRQCWKVCLHFRMYTVRKWNCKMQCKSICWVCGKQILQSVLKNKVSFLCACGHGDMFVMQWSKWALVLVSSGCKDLNGEQVYIWSAVSVRTTVMGMVWVM